MAVFSAGIYTLGSGAQTLISFYSVTSIVLAYLLLGLSEVVLFK
jgi:hypothetical protein